MKIPIVALPLIVALTAGCSSPVIVTQTAEPTSDNNGFITLYLDDQNGAPTINCVIPIANQTYSLDQSGDADECNNNDTHYFSLDNVPSATTIEFYDDDKCKEKTIDFYYKIRTIKNPTTTPTRIDSIKTGQSPDGTIMAPGVQLVYSNRKRIDDDLSCIDMKLSPKP